MALATQEVDAPPLSVGQELTQEEATAINARAIRLP